MATIIHYEEAPTHGDGNKEYVVITDDDVTPEVIEEHRVIGFKFYKSYELDGDTGTLPLNRPLLPRY